MKTKQEYITELTEAIELTKLQIEAIDKLLPAMKSLNGKSIRQQKYIQTKLREALPGFIVSFHEKFSWYSIDVYKTVNHCQVTVLQVNCGYISEIDSFDFDLIIGIKERSTGGALGNNYYFGTNSRYPDCKAQLVKYEKQLQTVEIDYKRYVELHEMVKGFNVPYLSIDLRR